ncbi:hypothetical protein [Streptomyces lasiicapitis]|uniref:hypothetical protein n=1 Tax=Streptomyces lasiicapitis TaxID=1923961 RepID=UPI0036A4840C
MSELSFSEIVAGLQEPTLWRAVYASEEACLQSERPGAFEPEEIGRRAWDRLTEAERADALDSLFYADWENQQQRADDKARWMREGPLKKQLQPLLAEFGVLAEASSPVPYRLVASIARLTHLLMVPCDPSCECPSCSSDRPGGVA